VDPLFNALPEDLSGLTVEELQAYIDEAQAQADRIAENPAEFLVEGRDFAALKAEMADGVSRIAAVKDELKARAAKKPNDDDADDMSAEKEELAALAEASRSETADEETEDEVEEAEEDEVEEVAAEAEEVAEEDTVVASAEKPASIAPLGKRRLSRPARSKEAEPPVEVERVALTAAAEGLGFSLGADLPDEMSIAEMMVRRRGQFGHSIPEGTHGDQIPIARADWSSLYPPERMLSAEDSESNFAKVAAVTASGEIEKAFADRRQDNSLVATGGLCAPVTPYYQLQMLSVANRPVRAALPAFNADRGGIRYARPATLASITTAVGVKTAAQDAAGGSSAQKTCQVVDCPPFQETDVEIIFHCLQFGNLGARTFPERVAQWNALVLAAHARTAETVLLDGIDAASTQVTASDNGLLGASSNLLSQALTAAQGLRSRHRMDPNTVLRVLYPYWVLDLLVSDVYKSQFERFDMTPDAFVRLLRAGNIEPTFYIDSATGKSQIYGTQAATALLNFPATVVWYLFPEGSFLYVDGGILELGLVRDSVLNKTNDFQIFGESFENVAFVGIESLAITSTTCDSGAVALPIANAECGDWSVS